MLFSLFWFINQLMITTKGEVRGLLNKHESTYQFIKAGAGVKGELARLHVQVHMSWEGN